MRELDDAVRGSAGRHEPPPDWLERVHRRAEQRHRNRRVLAATVGIGLSLAVFVPLGIELTRTETAPGGGSTDGPVTCGLTTPLTAVWRWEGTGSDGIGGLDAELRDNAGFAPGIAGEALTLDGDGDFGSVYDPALDVGAEDFTVALWVRFGSTERDQVLVEKWVQRGANSKGWTLQARADDSIAFYTGGGGGARSDPLDLRPETWIHVAVRRMNDTSQIFLNGERVAWGSGPVGNLDSRSSLKFGHRGGSDDTPGANLQEDLYLDGQIDEVVFVVGRALTDEEIRSLAERPDACAPVLPNAALGSPATASSSEAGSPASAAVDGSSMSVWNSGDYAPQWIEFDLGRPRIIGSVALLTTQLPDGETVHRILGRASEAEPFRLLHEFEGATSNSEWLEHAPPAPWVDIRFVRIETTQSPSWIGWREINVYAAP